jgi:hypothetical protein
MATAINADYEDDNLLQFSDPSTSDTLIKKKPSFK